MSGQLAASWPSPTGVEPRLTDAAELRVEVAPCWPYRLPRFGSRDGLTVVRGGVLSRLLYGGDGEPVLVRVAQSVAGGLLFGARSRQPAAARWAIARLRRALGVDLELRPFYERFRADPLIGASVRARPMLRPAGRPSAFEALACAITEQLIEYDRAVAIQRRIIHALGPSADGVALRDFPGARALAALAPARLVGWDLAAARARALRTAAALVVRGGVELDSEDPLVQQQDWQALRRLPGIGAWTVELMAVVGQGRLDQLPAGDLGFLKLVGRLLSGGDPQALASEQQVRERFEPYGDWRALAAAHASRAARRFSPVA